MFPVNLFKVDEKTKSIVATAADLGKVRGSSAIFEVLSFFHGKEKEENFGLAIDMGFGFPAIFSITEKFTREDRITVILVPTTNTEIRYPRLRGYKLIVVAKYG